MLRQAAFAAALLLAAIPASAQTLDVRVVEDSTGVSLANVELRFHKAGIHELAADLDTDRDGRVRTSDVPAGEYTVELSKPNYIGATLKVSVPSTGMVIRLVRFAVISGHVRDNAGKPLPGVVRIPTGRTSGGTQIAVMVKQSGGEALTLMRQTQLSEGGAYRITDLPPGQYALGLWYSGLDVGSGMQIYPDTARPRFFTVSGSEDYHDIDFTVTPGPSYSIGGKIEMPKTGTSYNLALGLPEQPALPIAQMWSEPDGKFTFERIPNGTYDLFVAGPVGGYGQGALLARNTDPFFGRMKVQVTGQNIENLSVPVAPGRTLSVVLHGPGSGGPPEGCPKSAQVGVTLLEPWSLMLNTRAQANFEKEQAVQGLPPARYRVSAVQLGPGCYLVKAPEVDLSGGEVKPVVLELAAAGRIRGVLRAGPAPAKDFTVMLLDAAGTSAAAQFATSDEQGHFAFEGLRPGRYKIAAQPAAATGRSRWIPDVTKLFEIEVAGGSVTEIELPVSPAAGGGR